MANRIIEMTTSASKISKCISIISTGNEMLSGDIINTNAAKIGQMLYNESILTKDYKTVSDSKLDIEFAIKESLVKSDAIIITGGLGPTSDDNSREAVSSALKLPLEFNEESFIRLKERPERFNIKVHESNKKQSFFLTEGQIIKQMSLRKRTGYLIEISYYLRKKLRF